MGIRCAICDATDKWENVDEYRLKQTYESVNHFGKVHKHPYNMSICNGCGFITYPDRVESEAKLIEFYRQEYRKAPNLKNIFQGQAKLRFHNAFLSDTFKQWKSENKKRKFLEIGSAIGMVLDWCRRSFPDCELEGTEITTSYRRVAHYLYGLNLKEDFDKKEAQNDMVIHYKVLEHQVDPDIKLRQLTLTLKPGGLLYISVPCWFHKMETFGQHSWDLEEYYHPNHCNVWSLNNFQNLLKKSGLRIIKENHTFYDETFLCVRDDSVMAEPRKYDDPAEIKKTMAAIKKAEILYREAKFEEALKSFANFPLAQIAAYESERHAYDKMIKEKGFAEFQSTVLDRMMKDCPNDGNIIAFIADIYRRYDKWEDAINWFNKALEFKPNEPNMLKQIASILRIMSQKTPSESEKYNLISDSANLMNFIREACFQDQFEALNWMLDDYSRLPLPDEDPEWHKKKIRGEK